MLLKYRVPFSGPYWDEQRDRRIYPKAPLALEDAQRTVGLVRFHAAEWHIDPHKIGVLGFSAGGHLVAGMSTHFEQRLYPAVRFPITRWPELVETWLRTIGMLSDH